MPLDPPPSCDEQALPVDRFRLIEYRRQTRSLLASIRAILRQMATRGHAAEEFAVLLEGRLGALARVHEMLLRALDAEPDLIELVNAEFLAQGVSAERVLISGAPLSLSGRVAASLALALHELTINAIQHGALGADRGRVQVSWTSADGAGFVKLHWRETGQTMTPDETNQTSTLGESHQKSTSTEPRNGFGWELLLKTLPYELGARVSLQLMPDGVDCVIEFQPRRGS